MKAALLALAVAGLFTLALPLHAQSFELSSQPAPGIVQNGLDSYRTNGSAAALDTWLAGSALAKSGARDTLLKQLSQFESANGKMLQFEIIGGISPSPSVRVNWFTICYAKGVAFVEFTSYQGKSSWVVTNIRLSADYRDILPAWQIPLLR